MLYTFSSGPSTGPAVIFLHGGGLSGKMWLPVIQRLPDFYCLAPDSPEQGRSSAIPFSIRGAANAVAEIIDRLPGGRAHMVGHSLSGPVIFTLLSEQPKRVQTAIISGSSGRVSPWLSRIGLSTIWSYRLFPENYLINATLKQQGIPEAYHDLLREDLRAALAPAFMRHYMSDLSTWELPERVEQPPLLAVGEKETRAALRFAKDYLKRYPGATGVVAPGVGHVWPLQTPDLFAAMVQAWVTGDSLPAELRPL